MQKLSKSKKNRVFKHMKNKETRPISTIIMFRQTLRNCLLFFFALAVVWRWCDGKTIERKRPCSRTDHDQCRRNSSWNVSHNFTKSSRYEVRRVDLFINLEHYVVTKKRFSMKNLANKTVWHYCLKLSANYRTSSNYYENSYCETNLTFK